MRRALAAARRAAGLDEVPVGAVLVRRGELVATAWNSPITAKDPTAHAEIKLLRRGAAKLANYRLVDCTVYVTLEPCMMCAGALVHARVKRVVYGAREPKAGALDSHELASAPWLNHRLVWQGGVLGDDCTAMLQSFFAAKRNLQGREVKRSRG